MVTHKSAKIKHFVYEYLRVSGYGIDMNTPTLCHLR